MPSFGQLAAAGGIAVRKQHRKARTVGAQHDMERRQHVGPVRVVRDAAKAFGLALRQQETQFGAARKIETGQRTVGRRVQRDQESASPSSAAVKVRGGIFMAVVEGRSP